jgi:hypothetical protein
MPKANDTITIDWGPKQIVQSTGARPYAKYLSNGVDKIYLTYTTGHPDNEDPNFVYFNYINIVGTDATKITLTDVKGKQLSVINSGVFNVNKTSAYVSAHPETVVDDSNYRNWVWEVGMDGSKNPVIAMVRISSDKNTHDYYHAKWTGSAWRKTHLVNGGGHFHQTSGLELCYSGGMGLDSSNPNIVYCAVPITGTHGKIYEIIKYTVSDDGSSVSNAAVTRNSTKNNVRPYSIPNTKNTNLKLVWLHGDYYDWIVSSTHPNGFPTEVHCDYKLPSASIQLSNGLLANQTFDSSISGYNISNGLLVTTSSTDFPVVTDSKDTEYTVTLSPYVSGSAYHGKIVQIGSIIYGLDEKTMKPTVTEGSATHYSSNRLANSDAWKKASRGTGGEWYDPVKLEYFSLTITYSNGVLRTYINGLLDQYLEISGLSLGSVRVGGFQGWVDDVRVYSRALNQDEVKAISDSYKFNQ